MKQTNMLAPIITRYVFFAINVYFSVQLTAVSGWSFLSIILILFATREFVHATRLLSIYRTIKKHNQNNQDQ